MFVRLFVSICLLVGERAQAQSEPSSKNITGATAVFVVQLTNGTIPAVNTNNITILLSNESISAATTNTTSTNTTSTNTTSPPVDEILPTTLTNESATGMRFSLMFTLETAFVSNLLNGSSAEFQTFKNQTECILNGILFSQYGKLFNTATVNSFRPGSGIVVNADLDFNKTAEISADSVKNTLALAASTLELHIAVNVSSIVVIALSPFIEPSQNSTIKVFADMRILSSIPLNATSLGSIIEGLVRDIDPLSLTQLRVTVKKFVRCIGDQCRYQQPAEPPEPVSFPIVRSYE